MASMMGVRAIECLQQNRYNRVIAYKAGEIIDIDIEDALKATKTISQEELDRAKILAI